MDKQHWPRWIWASLTQHFDSKKQNVKLYFEGYDRTKNKSEDLFELRQDGPFIKQVSKNYYHIDLLVNLLIQSIKDDVDAHKLYRLTGIGLTAFTDKIDVYRLGTGEDDSQTLLGCLTLVGDQSDLVVTHFGLVDGTLRLLQSTIEARYNMSITL